MFDLTLPHLVSSGKTHLSAQLSAGAPLTSVSSQLTSESSRPEVTGISPREGAVNTATKLVIRGTDLGESASDVISLTVAGVDCLATMDFESSSRLTCVVGPTTSAPTAGDVIVETTSGGVGISMVQFRFVDDEDQFTAVPYDSGESRQSAGFSLVHQSSSPATTGFSGTHDVSLSVCLSVSVLVCLPVCLSVSRCVVCCCSEYCWWHSVY